MGIIAWIVLGLGAGLLANMLIPGRRSQGLIITCVIGIAGALLGGWLATKLFHVVTLHGFFNLSTWLTAIAGAAVLLLAYHLLTSRTSSRRAAVAAVGHAGGRTSETAVQAAPGFTATANGLPPADQRPAGVQRPGHPRPRCACRLVGSDRAACPVRSGHNLVGCLGRPHSAHPRAHDPAPKG